MEEEEAVDIITAGTTTVITGAALTEEGVDPVVGDRSKDGVTVTYAVLLQSMPTPGQEAVYILRLRSVRMVKFKVNKKIEKTYLKVHFNQQTADCD